MGMTRVLTGRTFLLLLFFTFVRSFGIGQPLHVMEHESAIFAGRQQRNENEQSRLFRGMEFGAKRARRAKQKKRNVRMWLKQQHEKQKYGP